MSAIESWSQQPSSFQPRYLESNNVTIISSYICAQFFPCQSVKLHKNHSCLKFIHFRTVRLPAGWVFLMFPCDIQNIPCARSCWFIFLDTGDEDFSSDGDYAGDQLLHNTLHISTHFATCFLYSSASAAVYLRSSASHNATDSWEHLSRHKIT